jgi:putative hemolysin
MSSDPVPSRSRRLPTVPAFSLVTPAILAAVLVATPLTSTYAVVQQPAATGSLGLLAVALLLVYLLNALFVAGETAVDLLKPSHARAFDDSSRAPAILNGLMARRESVVAACVLGAMTMRAWIMLICFIAAPTVLGLFDRTPGNGVDGWFAILATAVILSIPLMGLNVVFFELVPRSWATAHPHRAAVRSAGLLRTFDFAFYPLTWLATRLAGLVTKRVGADAKFAKENQAEEEIKELLDNYEETGELDEEERDLLHSVFDFGDTVAREVMTPRVDLESVPVESSLVEIANLVEATGHSRFPVHEDTDDQIVGIVHAKDILRVMARGQADLSLRQIMRPAFFVPENKSLHDLLQEMRASKTQMVIVQDEFGGTAGIVTVEDIVEELVGDIVDEYDNETPDFVAAEDGHSVRGKTHLDDVNEELGTAFESDEFDTIGGYVFGLFGRQPTVGESLEHAGYRFVVEESDGRRIERVKIVAMPDEMEASLSLAR